MPDNEDDPKPIPGNPPNKGGPDAMNVGPARRDAPKPDPNDQSGKTPASLDVIPAKKNT